MRPYEQTTLPLGAGSIASYQVSVQIVSRVHEEPTPATGPEDAAAYWHAHVARAPWFDPKKEHLAALLLDTKLRIEAWNLVSVGSLNESIAHPREVFRPAVATACHAVILVHNHPSGLTDPSRADRALTDRLRDCGSLLGIPLLDHVIVGLPGQPIFHFGQHSPPPSRPPLPPSPARTKTRLKRPRLPIAHATTIA